MIAVEERRQEGRPPAVVVERRHARQANRAAAVGPGGIVVSGRRGLQAPYSGAAASLPEDAPAVTLGRPAPDAGFFSLVERVFETGLLHAAFGAHLLGDFGVFFSVGVEDARIEPPTRTQHPPLKFVC